jgi:hypothetical protein
VSNFSNLNDQVALMAPGEGIKAAVPNNKYDAKSGTSMAAPHVAGAFALLKDARRNATVDEILDALACTGVPVERSYRKPRIDVLKAVNYLRNPPQKGQIWNFDEAVDIEDWTEWKGIWLIKDGAYSLRRPNRPWSGTFTANCDTAFTATVIVKREDHDPDIHWNSGVVFKTAFTVGTQDASGYWFAINKSPRSENENAVLWAVNPLVGDQGSLLCKKGVPVNAGGYNALRVVSRGSRHALYVNGRLLCAYDESTFPRGPVMIAAANPAEDVGLPQRLDYDAVSIKTLREDASPSGVRRR